MRRLKRFSRLSVVLPCAMLASFACGSPSPAAPSAPPPTIVPTPQPPPPSPLPVPTGLPALAPCNETPNYTLEVLPELYRRERVPLRVSIAGDAETRAYTEGIMKGLTVWSTATNGALGVVEAGFDLPDPDVTLRIGTHPVYDCRVTRWHGIFADSERVPPRIVRRGGIYVCPANFNASPADVLPVAKVIGHEVGHALGILGHPTDDPADLMYGGDQDVPPASGTFPWVTARDRNTLGTAYCN